MLSCPQHKISGRNTHASIRVNIDDQDRLEKFFSIYENILRRLRSFFRIAIPLNRHRDRQRDGRHRDRHPLVSRDVDRFPFGRRTRSFTDEPNPPDRTPRPGKIGGEKNSSLQRKKLNQSL